MDYSYLHTTETTQHMLYPSIKEHHSKWIVVSVSIHT